MGSAESRQGDAPKPDQPLLKGTTPDGQHVELIFTDFGGRLKVGGEIVCESASDSDAEVQKVVKAFVKACGQTVHSQLS